MPTYKVLTMRDKLAGHFSPQKLEEALNALAADGWRAVNMVSANLPGFGKNDELMVLLERT